MHLCERTKTAICHSKLNSFCLGHNIETKRKKKTAQLQVSDIKTANSFIQPNFKKANKRTKTDKKSKDFSTEISILINAFSLLISFPSTCTHKMCSFACSSATARLLGIFSCKR